MASAYGRSRGLLCRVEEGGGEEEKARGDFYKWIVSHDNDGDGDHWGWLSLVMARSRDYAC